MDIQNVYYQIWASYNDIGRCILLFLPLFALPNNKINNIQQQYRMNIYCVDEMQKTWPVSMLLSTHAWLQFSIKINPIFICCLLFTFQRRHKKYDNGTRSIHIHSFRFKISFDFLLQLSKATYMEAYFRLMLSKFSTRDYMFAFFLQNGCSI